MTHNAHYVRRGIVSITYSRIGVKMNPTLFAKIAFGWEAFPYQQKVLDDESKRIIMACGRQVGNEKSPITLCTAWAGGDGFHP